MGAEPRSTDAAVCEQTTESRLFVLHRFSVWQLGLSEPPRLLVTMDAHGRAHREFPSEPFLPRTGQNAGVKCDHPSSNKKAQTQGQLAPRNTTRQIEVARFLSYLVKDLPRERYFDIRGTVHARELLRDVQSGEGWRKAHRGWRKPVQLRC